jgi:uncharacterized protein
MNQELYLRESYPVRLNDDPYLLVVPTTAFIGLDEVGEAVVNFLASRPSAHPELIAAAIADRFDPRTVAEALSELMQLGVVGLIPNGNGAGEGKNGHGNGHGNSHGPNGGPHEESQNLVSDGGAARQFLTPGSTIEGWTVLGWHEPVRTDPFDSRNLPMTRLTCHVAMDCNLRCTYCYADTGPYGGPRDMMCEGTARDYVDLLLKSSGDTKDVNFTFFGGEPFMNWKVMRATVLYGEQRAREVGKHIHFGVTTNGTLLDEEKIDFVVDHRVQVTVSMDGPPEVQNRFRILTDGQGSYDLVMAKVKPLLERMRVACRVTLTRKTLEVQRIVDHLLGLGFADVGIGVVSSPDSLMNLGPQDLPKLLDEFKACAARYVDAACKDSHYGFSNLTTILTQIHEGAAKSFGCGAGVQMFSGDPFGNLYSCHRLVGNAKYQVGTLQGGIDRDKQFDSLDNVHLKHKLDCQNCWARHLCGGGCFYQLEIHYDGDLQRAYTPFCDWIREWFTVGLRSYAQIMTENPAFIDRYVDPSVGGSKPLSVFERAPTL